MSDFFCPLPWISTSVRNDGVIRVCCHSNQGPNKGELNWDVDDIKGSRNSPRLKMFRKQILSGEWPEDCIRCKKESESGITTRFQYESHMWQNVINKKDAKQYTHPDGTIDTVSFPLIYYDLRFGNKCNLKCRYCSPYSSSALGTIEGDYNWFEREIFWSHLRSNMHNIDYFHVEGGEPMLIKQHYDFMEECIKFDQAKKIRIEYTSNLTTIPEKAWDLWSHFKEVRIGTSIDAVDDVFEYIRYPSKFDAVVENLRRLDKAPGNFELWIALTISTLNVWYLPEFFKWKIKQRFERVNRKASRPYCSDHPIHTPKYFNIKSLPTRVKAEVTDHLLASIPEIDRVADECEPDEFMRGEYKNSTRKIIYSYIKYMISEDLSDYHKKYLAYNEKLDKEYGQSMKHSMPEWYEVLHNENNSNW
jgi:sulfatase maturation enzyme AslB (radical SAM superfamily)